MISVLNISAVLVLATLSGCLEPLRHPVMPNPYEDLSPPETRKLLQEYLDTWQARKGRRYIILPDGISERFTDGSGRSPVFVSWQSVGKVGYIETRRKLFVEGAAKPLDITVFAVRLYKPDSVLYRLEIPFYLEHLPLAASPPAGEKKKPVPMEAVQDGGVEEPGRQDGDESLPVPHEPLGNTKRLRDEVVVPVVFLLERLRDIENSAQPRSGWF